MGNPAIIARSFSRVEFYIPGGYPMMYESHWGTIPNGAGVRSSRDDRWIVPTSSALHRLYRTAIDLYYLRPFT